MTLAVITGTATRLFADPGAVLRVGQCFPLQGAYVLGEHMLGVSILTAPSLWLGFDPTTSLNLALIATRFIAASGMYLLARRMVQDRAAAFVSGAVFGFGYLRVTDPVHPFVWGDHWTPFAMLFLARLLSDDRRRPWIDAIALSISVTLMVGESFYALLAGAIVGIAWLCFLAWHAGDRLRRRWPLLLAAAILPAFVASLVLVPYLHADELLLSAPPAPLFPFGVSYLMPGSRFFPGVLPLVLAAIGLLARRPATALGRLDPRA